MNKQQTAVEWMVEQLNKNVVDLAGYPHEEIALPIIEMALKKEKTQIEKAVWFGHDNKPEMIHVPETFASDYYTQTYGDES